MTDTFPRQHARTQRFTLGEPRTCTVSPDGRRVVFLRSTAGDDPVTRLWVFDTVDGVERLVADPPTLLGGSDEHLPDAERARRERLREAAAGISAYATDRAGTMAAFALAGRLFVADLTSAEARARDVAGPVVDPRPDPAGRRIAYVSGRSLRLVDLDGVDRVLVADDDPDVSWGSADFVAAEEMHRFRGFWWAPDGDTLAVCRVDERPVERWHIADPADPARSPTVVRYPRAGTANPDVSLHLVRLDGTVCEVHWDRRAMPYLVDVVWAEPTRLVIAVQSRDQRIIDYLSVDPFDGTTTTLLTDTDPAWVELVPGTPAVVAGGPLVTAADRDGARRLLVDGTPVTPPDLQIRAVVAADPTGIVLLANPLDDATVQHVWRRHPDGTLERLTDRVGVHTAATGGGTTVIRSATLEDAPSTTVHTLDSATTLRSFAEEPLVTPRPQFHISPGRRLATVVLVPEDHDGRPLPVLLDPYGGPHAQRAIRSRNAHATSQWFADRGFAVIVADGRGTPGRGTRWEREVHGDLATAALDDQIEALTTAATAHALDLGRVAIRGWSFGGYLAALAVLRRPDVFHAAVAGAPVTEWRLYDTHYTERYLGDPGTDPGAYDSSSLLHLRPGVQRPLLLIHGLADDNVVAAHTLQLSSALLAAGHPHEVLPLVGVTHMTPQEVVAENLLLHQLGFLRRSLGITTSN
ncbi:MAG: prolyl oligopeptidase family serine peptidase [Ilumatobacteraceae bacterium]